LTGKNSAKDHYDSSDHRSLWSHEQVNLWANAYKLFSKEFIGLEGQSNTQIALRFCLSYPMLSTTIPGMLTTEHVDENTSSSSYGTLTAKELQKFSNIYQNNNFFVRPKE
jgi:aryl-alcohol dehydrogenase-like predicted oxidoreductase